MAKTWFWKMMLQNPDKDRPTPGKKCFLGRWDIVSPEMYVSSTLDFEPGSVPGSSLDFPRTCLKKMPKNEKNHDACPWQVGGWSGPPFCSMKTSFHHIRLVLGTPIGSRVKFSGGNRCTGTPPTTFTNQAKHISKGGKNTWALALAFYCPVDLSHPRSSTACHEVRNGKVWGGEGCWRVERWKTPLMSFVRARGRKIHRKENSASNSNSRGKNNAWSVTISRDCNHAMYIKGLPLWILYIELNLNTFVHERPFRQLLHTLDSLMDQPEAQINTYSFNLVPKQTTHSSDCHVCCLWWKWKPLSLSKCDILVLHKCGVRIPYIFNLNRESCTSFQLPSQSLSQRASDPKFNTQ